MIELDKIKEENKVSEIIPISEIVNKKIYLFYSEKDKVDYRIYTDGNIEHLDTWMDKRSYQLDFFLKPCGQVKRFEFKISEANVIIIEKKQQERLVRNLYINLNNLYKLSSYSLYQVSISKKENIKIKKMENVK